MDLKHFLVILISFTLGVSSLESKIVNLCGSSTNASTQICKCNTRNSEHGLLTVHIDCSSKELTSSNFEAEILPIYSEELNLAWNKLEDIPNFESKTLKYLRLAHNKIGSTSERNFVRIANLTDLDLSWNGLELLSENTFAELNFLKKLDLSGNNLKRIGLNMFSPLMSLEFLDLSWNPRLNESTDIRELDFCLAYGLTPKLRTLKMEYCNLNEIHLDHAIGVQELHLGWNNLTKLSGLPRGLKLAVLSGNPITVLSLPLLPHLLQLEVLLLEDMPLLEQLGEYAFLGFPNLKTLSLQNSRSLGLIHPYAFGVRKVSNETDKSLERLNLRGTKLKRLNSTLEVAFEHLKILDLTGLQLVCDCNLKWIRGLNIETGGRCNDPIALRGLKLSELNDSQFECNNLPSWASQIFNGLLIFLLIVLCSAGIWLLVMGLRPSHKKASPKLGNTSPYARITIEPNQVENYY